MIKSQNFCIFATVFPLVFLSPVFETFAFFPVTKRQENQVQYLGFPQSETALYRVLGHPHYATSKTSSWILEDGWYLEADRTYRFSGTFKRVRWTSPNL